MADDEIADTPLFKSKIGLVLACMGSVVGTGNIWRYPRIVANNSGDEGGLVFLILWAIGLWVWSIPIILIEYAVGRYTRKTVITSFKALMGPWCQWMGGWITCVMLLIGGYYSVVLGWCFYFFIYSIAYPLPANYEESYARWDELHDTKYPLLCHFIACFLGFLCIIRGVKTVELANKIIVPILLLLVMFSLAWSLSLPYAYEAITYLFSPDWDVLKTSQVWVDAVTQNAWDTGAAGGLFLTYATYMRRHDGVVSMGTLTPLANNFVSLCCGITIFCNVFSVLEMEGRDRDYVVSILKDNGPANTGLTFIWMPLLYQSISVGRFLAVLFFLSLSFAGLSSLIAMYEFMARTLENMGLPRLLSAFVVFIVLFLIGLPSSLNLDILVNQDSVWGFALIVSGLMLITLVLYYGADKFRTVLVNDYGLSDWKLRKIWSIVIWFVSPIVGAALIIWWIVSTVKDDPRWYYLENESLIFTLYEWAALLIVVLAANTIYQVFVAKPKVTLDTIQDGSVEVGKTSKTKTATDEEYLVTRKLVAESNSSANEETSSL